MNPERNVPIPSRDSVTAIQVNTLLTIVGTLSHALMQATTSDGGETDGGTKLAVESTLIGVLNRLDGIVDDVGRWNVATLEALEKKCHAVYDNHLLLMVEQKKAVEAMQAPHRNCNPTLVHLDNGQWAAVLGDLRTPGQAIVGLGDTPQNAIEDFDLVFKGKQTQPNVIIEPPNEKPVDPGTDKPVSEPEKRRKNKRRSRPDSGTD